DGYTAIGQLQEERAEQFRFDELYNEEEKRRLDSIERAFKNQRPFSNNGDSENDDEDRELQQALSSLQRKPEPIKAEPNKTDPMELFRRQMAYADSMARANDPDEQAARRERERMEEAKKELENQPRLSVSKYGTG